MERVKEQLQHNRPNLSPSTIKTYMSILSNLYNKINGSGDAMDWFEKNLDKVMTYLKDEKQNVRKTKMAVMVSLFSHKPDMKGIKNMREVMIKDANQYNAKLRDQQLTDKQRENWISMDEIKSIWTDLQKRCSPLLKKSKLSKSEWNDTLLFIMLSIYVLNPPRRSQDYAVMKIRNYNPEQDNHYDGKFFTFRHYKTSKNYGEQIVRVSPKLNNILKAWIKINPHDYLLSTYGGKPLSVSRMTLLFNRLFGKNVSTSMIRHVYLTEQYKDVPALRKMDKLAADMGHSTDMALEYVKKK